MKEEEGKKTHHKSYTATHEPVLTRGGNTLQFFDGSQI